LYINDFEEMHKCPRCGISWYKVKDDDECSSDESTKKGPLAMLLWYLPIMSRFKRLFANTNDTKDLTWHAYGRNCDGCSTIRLIPLNGRRLIVYIWILEKRKKILGLDLPVME